MQILSPSFFFLFLPVGLALYWIVFRKPRGKLWFLLVFSYLFYFLADGRYLLLLIGLSILNYLIAGKRVYWLGIIINVLALATFKIWGASFGPLMTMLAYLGMGGDPASLELAVPLGISYYVFKNISYLIDVHKNRYPVCKDWLVLFVYGAFFAEISAGPISNFEKTGSQLANLPTHQSREASFNGLVHLAIGLGKKVLLVESIAVILDLAIYQTTGPNSGFINLLLLTFLQGIYLYLDFSSYSDIALGLGFLFGITLPVNFNSPYRSQNPSQFWQRWHITLSTWFRVYVFSPLSRLLLTRFGSKRRFTSQVVANLITMTLVGLWHGIHLGFMLWGAYHGLLLSLHAWLVQKRFRWIGTWIDQALSMIAIFGGWVFFFSTSKLNLWMKLQSAAGLAGWGEITPIFSNIPPSLFIPLLVMLPVAFSRYADASALVQLPLRRKSIALLAGLLLALTLLLLGEPGDFTYVQF